MFCIYFTTAQQWFHQYKSLKSHLNLNLVNVEAVLFSLRRIHNMESSIFQVWCSLWTVPVIQLLFSLAAVHSRFLWLLGRRNSSLSACLTLIRLVFNLLLGEYLVLVVGVSGINSLRVLGHWSIWILYFCTNFLWSLLTYNFLIPVSMYSSTWLVSFLASVITLSAARCTFSISSFSQSLQLSQIVLPYAKVGRMNVRYSFSKDFLFNLYIKLHSTSTFFLGFACHLSYIMWPLSISM